VRPTSGLVAALALVVVAAFLSCAAFGYLLARESDIRHQIQQRASLIGVVDEFRSVFADVTLRAAASPVWETGIAAEFTQVLGPMGLARYRYDQAYLVSASGRLLASYPPAAKIPAGLARIIAAFHEADEASAKDGAAAGDEHVVTDFAIIDERPALVATAPLRAPSARLRENGRPAMLVHLTGLETGLVGMLETMSGVSDLAFEGKPPQADREVRALLDAKGRIVGWLSWKREHPMMDAVTRLTPLLTTVAACLICFAGLAIRQIGRTTSRLAASEAKALKIAYEDPVTGLPNRRKLFDLLDGALGARTPDEVVSFALIDADGCKDIRESVSDESGNELLAAVGERLRAALPAATTLARVGENEFAMIVRDADGSAGWDAARTALKATQKPFRIGNHAVQAGLTIGLVQAPDDGDSRDDLMRRADLARRMLKGGETRIGGFAREMEQEFRDRLFLKQELRRAVVEQAFEMYYQPIVAADGQHIVGVEALMRWNHPSRGFISPAEFIPVAEENGMMGELGAFALRQALADVGRWRNIYVAVNLSPVQVRDRAFMASIASTIARAGISHSRVVLEITEGVLIGNPAEAKERFEQLRKLGVKIALDDFGSGYSSLGYLRNFPIDKLKIDKQFIAPIGRSPESGVVLQAIMALGRALGLTVLCEGVETEEQRVLLRIAGCDEMQGFLFSRAVPRDVIDRLIREGGQPMRASA
jgi:diguanylate cyclase (GGDEF)-like protein